jgi:hypothetical protein
MLGCRSQHFEARLTPEEDVVRHGIVVGHEAANKLARIDSQGVGPEQVTVRRNTTSTVF